MSQDIRIVETPAEVQQEAGMPVVHKAPQEQAIPDALAILPEGKKEEENLVLVVEPMESEEQRQKKQRAEELAERLLTKQKMAWLAEGRGDESKQKEYVEELEEALMGGKEVVEVGADLLSMDDLLKGESDSEEEVAELVAPPPAGEQQEETVSIPAASVESEEKKAEAPALPAAFYAEEERLQAEIALLADHPEQENISILKQLANAHGKLSALYASVGKMQEARESEENEAVVRSLLEVFGVSSHLHLPAVPVSVSNPRRAIEEENDLLEDIFNKSKDKWDVTSILALYEGEQEQAGREQDYAQRIVHLKRLRMFIYSDDNDEQKQTRQIAATFVHLGNAYADLVPAAVDIASASEMQIHHLKTAARCLVEAGRLASTQEIAETQRLQEEIARLKGRIPGEMLVAPTKEAAQILEQKRSKSLIHKTFIQLIHLYASIHALEEQERCLKEWIALLTAQPASTSTARNLAKAYRHLVEVYSETGMHRPEEAQLYAEKEQEALSVLNALEMARQQEKEEKEEAQTVAAAAKQKEAEDRIAALLEAAPLEEREALRHIFQQEQKNIATDQDLADFIAIYKMLPEKYERHIRYLEEYQNLKQVELWCQGDEKIAVHRQTAQALASVAETYLSQYAVDFRRDNLELAHAFHAQANKYLENIATTALQTGSMFLYVPLCMHAMLMQLEEKVKTAKAVMITDAQQLEKWQRDWPHIKSRRDLPLGDKVIHLSGIIYLCGKLEQYPLQAIYLEELFEMTRNTNTAAVVQTALLLSDLYCRLGKLEKAEEFWQIAEGVCRMFSMYPHDRALFRGMLETYSKQLETAKARAIEAQRAALLQATQEEEELDEGALLAQAMAMSLQEEEQPGLAEAEVEGEGLEEKMHTLPSSTTDALIPLPSAKVLPREDVWIGFGFDPSALLQAPVSQGLFSPSARKAAMTEQELAVKRESRALALARGEIGPSELPGWELQDVEDDGNCFYAAVVIELGKKAHPFLQTTPEGMLQRDYLRQRIQGADFQEGEWADTREVIKLVCDPELNVVLMIVDTRYPDRGFVYHYQNEAGKYLYNKQLSEEKLQKIELQIEGKTIIRLAYTGDHYLSVTHAPWDAPEDAYVPPVLGM